MTCRWQFTRPFISHARRQFTICFLIVKIPHPTTRGDRRECFRGLINISEDQFHTLQDLEDLEGLEDLVDLEDGLGARRTY